jgi:hypothetical protein
MRNILFFLTFSTTLFAGLKQKETDELKYPSLSLKQENFISDSQGVLNPNLLGDLRPGHIVLFYLPDGTKISGLVKKIESDSNKIFKLFGDALNQKNCGFGFVIADNDIFAGALVFRDEDKTYTVKYSEILKGFILEYQAPKIKIQ